MRPLLIVVRPPFPGTVVVDGIQLDPRPSQALRNHSPDGFAWGYGGSGPAQTALAILLHVSRDPDIAERHYQAFKWEHVATWPQEAHEAEVDVEAWLAARETISHVNGSDVST